MTKLTDVGQTVDHSAIWASWLEEPVDFPRRFQHVLREKSPLYETLLRYCPPGAMVLEVGAGSCVDSCYLATLRRMAHFNAVDLSHDSLRVGTSANEHFGTNVRLVCADGRNLPFADGAFDLVFSQGLIEHFKDPSELVLEQLRVLRDAAILVVDVPQTFNLYTIYKRRRMRNGTWPWGWETQYSYRQIRGFTKTYGVRLLRASGWGYDRYTGLLRWPLVKLRLQSHRLLARLIARVLSCLPPVYWTLIERAWRFLERSAGHLYMQSITGVFQKGG